MAQRGHLPYKQIATGLNLIPHKSTFNLKGENV